MKRHDIAKELGVDPTTISRDTAYLVAQSQDNLNSLAKETLPFMYQTSIEGIRDVIKECWNVYQGNDNCRGEPGVSMLKRYLGCYRIKDNLISFDGRRLWEFRFKLQYEESRVKVINSSDCETSTLLFSWNQDIVEEIS
jgi:hypothetical protein